LNKFQEILKKYWGHSAFRELQEDIIQSVIDGNDTLALMPTGGGKSITFQIPALYKDGICIVITPLIALMKDQVKNLQEKGVKAVAIYSGMSKREIDYALENCVYDKNLKFLYCSPERLNTDIFKARVRQMNVSLLAIDEAHCISQWGYDFRPAYLKIAELREFLPNTPILAVTATATKKVTIDIQKKLLFKKENLLKKSFKRDNIVYLVREVDDKQKYLLKIINSINGTGIVYTRNRQRTKEVSELLQENNISSGFYHAGLSFEDRNNIQNSWKNGETRVIVSTNAFGMGIDKDNVRFVVHIDMPDNIEAYFQEAGRAGRDGKQAFAVLLYHPSDKKKLKQRINTTFPETDTIIKIYDALGNFFQIPMGFGKGMSFDFNMSKFAKLYKININILHNSLKILQNNGYIELSEEVNNPSRIMFIIQRDELYKYQIKNKLEDNFIRLLLRTYTGLFSNYQRINENVLANKLNVKLSNITELLIKLGRDKIISYIPRKKVPQIYFSAERLEKKAVTFNNSKYRLRKELYKESIESMLSYATTQKCRSQQLLAYFNEDTSAPCEVCDICTKRNSLGLKNYELDIISNDIKTVLQKTPLNIENLVDTVNKNNDKVIKVIQWLLDNEIIIQKKDLLLYWK
jgi:ATP-dependent DNA helicase RecQ